jgi:hypothetical protein
MTVYDIISKPSFPTHFSQNDSRIHLLLDSIFARKQYFLAEHHILLGSELRIPSRKRLKDRQRLRGHYYPDCKLDFLPIRNSGMMRPCIGLLSRKFLPLDLLRTDV